MRVVPGFDEVEDGHASLDLGAKRLLVEQLALKRCEEALAHRVVIAVGHRAHRGTHARLLADAIPL